MMYVPGGEPRILSDGREGSVIPLVLDRARLCIGPAGALWYDAVW